MKKVLAIFAIAGMFAACNNEAETGMSAEDSIRRADSLRDVQMKDSMDRAMQMQQDTANMKADTAGMKRDSLTK
ncbi:MAG TPA: hypothetical protein VEB42_05675 [Chitinophagaceae bacterium]|nr:hypothetical protein [Chitinophagaceae bacterium]